MDPNNMATIYHVDKYNKQQTANQSCQVCQSVCQCQDATSNAQLGINYFGVGTMNEDFEF